MEKLQVGRCGRPRKDIQKAVLLPAWRVDDGYHLVQFRRVEVGAAFGGALGVAASPLVVPGLALAALVGGAGGYQWAKYWGSQDCKRHEETSDDAMIAHSWFHVQYSQAEITEPGSPLLYQIRNGGWVFAFTHRLGWVLLWFRFHSHLGYIKAVVSYLFVCLWFVSSTYLFCVFCGISCTTKRYIHLAIPFLYHSMYSSVCLFFILRRHNRSFRPRIC